MTPDEIKKLRAVCDAVPRIRIETQHNSFGDWRVVASSYELTESQATALIDFVLMAYESLPAALDEIDKQAKAFNASVNEHADACARLQESQREVGRLRKELAAEIKHSRDLIRSHDEFRNKTFSSLEVKIKKHEDDHKKENQYLKARIAELESEQNAIEHAKTVQGNTPVTKDGRHWDGKFMPWFIGRVKSHPDIYAPIPGFAVVFKRGEWLVYEEGPNDGCIGDGSPFSESYSTEAKAREAMG